MASPRAPDPDLRAATRALLGCDARFVVIGGFAVIANDYVRATEDIDLLVPDDPENDLALDRALHALHARWPADGRRFRDGELRGREHTRLVWEAGLLDLLREGEAPLDFASLMADAHRADLGDGAFPVAGLASVVAFKRLAGRPRDRLDLEELAARHGVLPQLRVPGLDDA